MLLLSFIVGDVLWCIAGQLVKLMQVLIDGAATLAQVAKLFLLQGHHAWWNMCMAESLHKLISSDGLSISVGLGEVIPPLGCRSIKMVRDKEHPLTISALDHVPLPANCSKQSSASIGSILLERVGGHNLMNSTMLALRGGGAIA